MIDTILTISTDSWEVLAEMSPYILFGFFVAGVLSVLLSSETVEKHLGGNSLMAVVKASLFGVPLPLCSCGVIPVAASLRRHGASQGATTSFLISTPQTGIDSIMVTFSLLGAVFAVFRPLAAFISGIIGGILTIFFGDKNQPEEIPAAAQCQGGTCNPERPQSGKIINALHYGFVALPQDIARALLIGIVIAGVISALIPDDFFLPLIGTGIGAMLVMMLLGIPIYVCATASVPVAAALIAKGVSPGAALVFLMTGPATNAATIATVWKVLGKRTAVVYLGTVAFSALTAGFLLDYVIKVTGIPAAPAMPWMLPGYVKTISALALLALLGYALYQRSAKKSSAPVQQTDKSSVTLKVSGMTCNHCVNSVTRALKESAGVDSAEVDLKSGRAVVAGKDFDSAALVGNVEKLGYKAEVVADS